MASPLPGLLPAPPEPHTGRARYRSAPPPPPRTLLDVLDATAAAHPEALALDTGAERFTYRALAAEVASRAERLRRAGAGPGDRVGVRIPSGTAELYLSVLAVLRCGAAYVPVDADDPDERAATVFREAGVCAVLGAGGALAPGTAAPSGGAGRPPVPDDDAWIIFTSGSTGAPKGVAVSHRAAAAFADAEAGLFLRDAPLRPGDRVLAGLSVAFDASCEEMWLAWRHGACLVPAPRSLVRAGHELGPWLVERGITVVSTVPTLAALWPVECLEGVRLLIVGGEACPAELVDRFAVPGREMWNTYGPTETTVVACAARLHPGQPVRIGLPLTGWELAVVDEAGELVAHGAEGELVVAGVGVARYLDPVKDAERYRACVALDTDRAYRTGDLVRADPEGLVFAGRADDQIKIGGRRLELGEIDAALSALPGVLGAAAAVRTTPAGGRLLAGYVVPGPEYDREHARRLLTERLPAALVPVLAEVDDLPTRTSGKVDRDALPWPLSAARPDEDDAEPLHGTAARLARLWEELLGTRPTAGSDFVALGGTSLAAARMASALREHHPGVSVAALYRHPVLRDMAAHLDSLTPQAEVRRAVRPLRRRTGAAQILVQTALFGVAGLRGLVGLAAADNVLGLLTPRAWAPHTSWWLVLTGWLVLLSAPSRFLLGAAAARLLTRGVAPGSYPRGGRVHLRLWAAERTVASFGVPALLGTPWATWYARSLGCVTGRNVSLHAMPPVTGLAEFGAGSAVEPEADISGWWLDGSTLHVGAVQIGANARVGHRSMLMPGASLGPGAELAAGGCLDGHVPAGRTWAGSPARPAATGSAPAFVPAQAARHTPVPGAPRREREGGGRARSPHRHSRRWNPAYALSLAVLPLLPLVAAAPALAGTYYLVKDCTTLTSAALWLLAAVPPFAFATTVCWVLLVALVVRALGRGITPGDHPVDGGVAWRVWLVTRLLDGSRTSLFPLYASLATPVWLRMLGARVGRRTEISTVLPLPSLLTVEDGAFLADDTLVAPFELKAGRMRLGRVRIGRRAFVGNSGIVGPGRTVPDDGLVGVLSDAPEHGEPGGSWLGRPAMPLPRVASAVDAGRTFEPPRRLVLARAAVEVCRVLPLMCALALAEAVLLGEQGALDTGGPGFAALVGAPLLLTAGVAAALTATAAKWVLVGRFKVGEHPLWSSFVWRNELYDTFVETLAVPWLAGPFTGTPVLNWWLRSLGARIGRGVWCDTHWLPETDLVTLGDGATVNRGCVLQTHLFHDRIMRMDTVHLAAGASLGPHGIVLPGTTVGEHAAIDPASLVMRGESVPAGTHWAGNPIAGAAPVGAGQCGA
ncbi:amino acid adenylation protein [Streptomyces cinnamoneus]|uniref:Amino acid adenylation protein n=2 Tax=Streptomyces cinnamoneus TaxID=53446 RepID=A0A2G1XJS0_STRCJ|nr:Pls/PosA family non-ribosomal peptide synthetase [Streptomyces cinnamoneus]PHQ51421.1 amino acid adenylation protein [Streptomyces cinnamoneus]PPT11762.1 amino acid adenylation protein [Streptomyces cinnamoneus]